MQLARDNPGHKPPLNRARPGALGACDRGHRSWSVPPLLLPVSPATAEALQRPLGRTPVPGHVQPSPPGFRRKEIVLCEFLKPGPASTEVSSGTPPSRNAAFWSQFLLNYFYWNRTFHLSYSGEDSHFKPEARSCSLRGCLFSASSRGSAWRRRGWWRGRGSTPLLPALAAPEETSRPTALTAVPCNLAVVTAGRAPHQVYRRSKHVLLLGSPNSPERGEPGAADSCMKTQVGRHYGVTNETTLFGRSSAN